jgi:uncharacterized membrane protein
MRSNIVFVSLIAVAAALVAGFAILVGGSVINGVLAFGFGVIITLIGSVIVNTLNADLYGRRLWEDQGQMEGLHERRIRRDRGVRHTEAPATFPAGDVA